MLIWSELSPSTSTAARTASTPGFSDSCTYNSPSGAQVADPPVRIKFFLDQFPNRSTFTTICQPDLSGGLQQPSDTNTGLVFVTKNNIGPYNTKTRFEGSSSTEQVVKAS